MPILTMRPSWTAMTGEPALAKMLTERRFESASTGRAALWPLAMRFLASRSVMSSA